MIRNSLLVSRIGLGLNRLPKGGILEVVCYKNVRIPLHTGTRLFKRRQTFNISTTPNKHYSFHTTSIKMSSIPQTQIAVQVHENGGPEVLKQSEIPVPEVPVDGLLVKNQLVGINYIDTYFRTGIYKTANFPYTPGSEGEGIVSAVGPNAEGGFKVGNRVVYLRGNGSYAQYSAVPAAYALKLPESIKPGYGAASLIQGATALAFIREAAGVKAGDWVAVTAAAGGVGTILIQALHKLGAKIIASTSTEEKRKLVKELGADYVVPYDNWEKDVLEITGGKGVNYVFDSLGKDFVDSAINIAGKNATVIFYGNATGLVPPFDIMRTSPKGLKIIRANLFAYIGTSHIHLSRECMYSQALRH